MFGIVKTIVTLVYIFTQVSLVSAQTETENKEETIPIFKTESPLSEEKITKSFLDFINKEAYAAEISREEEKKILRENWKQFLGVDIFYPYFKKKEIKERIEEKTAIEFLKIKGRAKFQDHQIKYIFKIKF